MVGNETYRINGFPGRPCGYKDLLSCQVLGISGLPQYIPVQHFGLRHLAGPRIPAGQITAGRRNDLHAVPAADLQIILKDRVLIHIGVHGRGNDFPAPARHDGGGQHVVRNAMGNLADHIGRGRGHHHNIRLLCKGHMLHAELKVPVKCIHQTLIAGQAFKCYGVDEVGCIPCHQHMHFYPLLDQHAGKNGNLICGNTACYSQKYGLSF